MNGQQRFPRELSSREREWLDWILPNGRPGYREFHHQFESFVVIGQGRRGEGEIILGKNGDVPDISAPLPSVFAYGVIETSVGNISITIREVLEGQASLEIVSHQSETLPAELVEHRRWTYSTWSPGMPCPQCDGTLREVGFDTRNDERLTLAICTNDKRIWIFEHHSEVNRLIPVTNFYNELMLQKNIRDPKIALDSKNFFRDINHYTDADLVKAFGSYNKLRSKIHLTAPVQLPPPQQVSFLQKITNFFRRSQA